MSGVTVTSPVPVTQIPVFWMVRPPVEVVRGVGEVKPSQPVKPRTIIINARQVASQNMRLMSTTSK